MIAELLPNIGRHRPIFPTMALVWSVYVEWHKLGRDTRGTWSLQTPLGLQGHLNRHPHARGPLDKVPYLGTVPELGERPLDPSPPQAPRPSSTW